MQRCRRPWVGSLGSASGSPQPVWRGVVVAPESHGAPYDADDYRYPLSGEAQIVAALGGVYGPRGQRIA